MAEVVTPKDTVQDEALYYTKEGRTLLGSVAPTAYAWSYPWPPCPTNLNKNKVYRPKEKENKEVVNEVKEDFKKESKPLDLSEIGVTRTMVPEIELALYWNRHPYEFRPPLNLNRAKSAANLSSLGELIQVDHVDNNHTTICRSGSCESRRSRSSSASVASKKSNTRKKSASDIHNAIAADNQTFHGQSNSNHKSKSSSPAESNNNNKSSEDLKKSETQPNPNPRIPKILQVLNQNEKRKFDEIKRVESNGNYNYSKAVRDTTTSRMHPNSVGCQATLDDVTKAALKSTYLCPLHGQYRQGVERRSKSGFRTDMSSSNINPHARCSRSRTKLVKSAECQTDNGSENSGDFKMKKNRSKTAGANNQKRRGNTSANNNMLSEYHGNYRHPGHIAASENRRLRNKILSYCFTKHSIF